MYVMTNKLAMNIEKKIHTHSLTIIRKMMTFISFIICSLFWYIMVTRFKHRNSAAFQDRSLKLEWKIIA